jgi:uncharacterized protein YbcC (UPF0753/DUF2309 family)
MNLVNSVFDLHKTLHDLKHFLPAQAPLKDFIHHNTLHAFQDKHFFDALNEASTMFGYITSLSIGEYRTLFEQGKIDKKILDRTITEKKGAIQSLIWSNKVYHAQYIEETEQRVGALRANWKTQYKIDLDSMVHPNMFRILCSYLDQGISIWNFPGEKKSFLSALRDLEKNSFFSFFKNKRAKAILLEGNYNVESLLKILIGDSALFEQYVFDQQFAHPGWSGLVATVESMPQTLLDRKNISLEELIIFESLLEIDVLDSHFGEIWAPLGEKVLEIPAPLFDPIEKSELSEVLQIWQEAYEWTYYDQVLAGIKLQKSEVKLNHKTFQAFFCIDDRECSIRRHVESLDSEAETFGTPGHFNLDFYYKPENGNFHTKVCPAPLTPKYLIKEIENKSKQKKDFHFNTNTHGLFIGWILTHTLGFWSGFRLFWSIFRPGDSPSAVSSFRHMDPNSTLTIENKSLADREDDLQIGFTVTEMTDRLEGLLKSTGAVKDFADVVYLIGHGASSVNNTHYAGYDCGACSGRPGSVNARVMSDIANNPKVRIMLAERGIIIPFPTQFLGALHDTTKDDIVYFDEQILNESNKKMHAENKIIFSNALDLNAKERSRKFMSINSHNNAQKVHKKVRLRTVSLFEPRPELNHATNTLCLIGRRSMTKGIMLDRRAFLNSFDYRVDPDGKFLLNILNAAAPVSGGINLEYYFSRVDNQKLGAGTKLPHNVMGLIGVANGIDGDLRPGLPSQMIEVHDPLRLMMVVEHFPEVVLETIQRNSSTYEWFQNEWVKLAVYHPETKEIFVFKEGQMALYNPMKSDLEVLKSMDKLVESGEETFPVILINNQN